MMGDVGALGARLSFGLSFYEDVKLQVVVKEAICFCSDCVVVEAQSDRICACCLSPPRKLYDVEQLRPRTHKTARSPNS